MKTIAIIGGMGPQASLHAHKRLLEKLIENGKKANIVHVSLDIEPFYSTQHKLSISAAQMSLLWQY